MNFTHLCSFHIWKIVIRKVFKARFAVIEIKFDSWLKYGS